MNVSPRQRRHNLLHQPDSLKLATTLSILKHLYIVAGAIDNKFGDKASEKIIFASGVQGRITKPNWNRDYTYFLAKIEEVRSHLLQFCVKSALNDLQVAALDIFNRFDNRRRMGVEITVLAMLTNKNSSWFDVPDKYFSADFVIEMLVSCKHRFQKPDKCYFWSRQTESMLTATFATTRNLTKLKLAIANDRLLTALAVHCRQLQELELQLAWDISEEGLFALAGKSSVKQDQGNPKPWPRAHCLNKDFGQSKEWFVKDSLMFTPNLNVSKAGADEKEVIGGEMKKMSKFFDTGFGCLELVKLRISGDFVFPPMAKKIKFFPNSFKQSHHPKGPILEHGFYVMLVTLKKLQCFIMNGLPLVIANLPKHFALNNKPYPMTNISLGLKNLTLDKELLEKSELSAISSICKNVTELNNLSADCTADWEELAHMIGMPHQHSPRFYSSMMCDFLKTFKRLKSIQGRIPLPCFTSFLCIGGRYLTKVHLSTQVVHLSELLVLRKFSPNLEILEGKFIQDENAAEAQENAHILRTRHFIKHESEKSFNKCQIGKIPGKFSQELNELLNHYPMRKLARIDLEGSLSISAFQLLVGNVENLEDLHLTNVPNDFVHSDGKALSDDWLDSLLHVNKLHCIKNLTLRLDNEHTVESGSFSERGLHKFLMHCIDNSPKITNLTGEFTKITDKKLMAKNKLFVGKGLRRLKIRNAVPYRRFDNMHDNERHYSVNEGYHAMLHEEQQELQQQLQPQPFQTTQRERKNGSKRFSGYVFRPFPKPINVTSSDEDEN